MKNDFEKKLSQLKIKPVSDNYQQKALKILAEQQSQKPMFNWSYLLAFCLLSSLTINWYQYKQPVKTNGNALADNKFAQKQRGGYSTLQGSMIPYTGNHDITILMEN